MKQSRLHKHFKKNITHFLKSTFLLQCILLLKYEVELAREGPFVGAMTTWAVDCLTSHAYLRVLDLISLQEVYIDSYSSIHITGTASCRQVDYAQITF